jgi:PIN domain nuclease of toxin-antitoxin system
MPAVMADTHAVVWYLEASPRLSPTALTAIRTAIQAGDLVYVSAVSLVEIAYLVEKGRLAADTFDRIVRVLQHQGSGLMPIAFDLAMADTMRQIPVATISDMPDRMIAATASHLNVPLVTADQRIRSSPLATIW